MSNQEQQHPYAGRQLNTDKIVHKTLTAATLGEIDTLMSDALNEGWQPTGPLMQLQDGTFAVTTVKVPRPTGGIGGR
jgi:hypothetical protein